MARAEIMAVEATAAKSKKKSGVSEKPIRRIFFFTAAETALFPASSFDLYLYATKKCNGDRAGACMGANSTAYRPNRQRVSMRFPNMSIVLDIFL